MNTPETEWPFNISDDQPERKIGFYDQTLPPDLMYKYTTPFEIKTSIHHCFACEANKFTKPLELSNFQASIMVVGQYPEDVNFSTTEGKMLADTLMWAQMDLSDIYFTSLMKCQESKQPEQCRHHLVSEVTCVQPSVILALGYDVGIHFDETINCAGYTSRIFQQYPMITTYDMSYVMGNQEMFHSFCHHIVQAKQIMDQNAK